MKQKKSSKPINFNYALSPIEKEVIRVVRSLTWCPLDDLTDTIQSNIPHAGRSNIYRTLKAFGINQTPQKEKEKTKKFKE